MVAARQACPDLEQRIAQTLGRAGGTRRTTSTVDPGPGGVKCSDASVCREISAFNAELVSRSCAAFSVTANVD
jgi:hypothetical protein